MRPDGSSRCNSALHWYVCQGVPRLILLDYSVVRRGLNIAGVTYTSDVWCGLCMEAFQYGTHPFQLIVDHTVSTMFRVVSDVVSISRSKTTLARLPCEQLGLINSVITCGVELPRANVVPNEANGVV